MLAVAAVVVAGGITAWVLAGDDDDAPTPQPTPTLVTGHGLDTGGEALATLLADARNHTFHARYAVRGNAKLLGGALELEWWNTAGHSRIDTIRTTDGSVTHTASIVNGDGADSGINCQQLDEGPWSCRNVEVPAPGDPNGIIATLTAQLSGRSVLERAGEVDGRPARCFRVTGGTDPLDVCTNADGVLLRNATPEVAYVITDLDQDVPDSIFDPPAPVK
jgi:hypothetical protein